MAVVETERHGQVLIVRMNRPERLNALSGEMRTMLAETWTAFRHDNDLEVAIFTGAGRGFCAGEDMKESLQRGAPGGERPAMEDPFMTGALEKPVIAAVNGFALGGGCETAMACTIRVAAESAKFGQPEVKLGLIPGYGGTQRLPRLIGEARALEMILTGRVVGADEALHIGLTNRIADGDLLEAGKDLAREMTSYSLPVLRFAREAIRRGLGTSLREGLEIEADLNTLAFHTKDAAEGMAAFLEKREPSFRDG